NGDRTAGLAFCDELRQSGKSRPRAPIAFEQVLKRPRPDVVAAEKPQPVESFPVVKQSKRLIKRLVGHQLDPIRDSVPAASRAMLARCLSHNMTAIRPNTSAAPLSPATRRASGVSALALSAAAEE